MRGRLKGDIVNNWDEKLKGGCRNIRTLGRFGIAAFNTLYFNRCRLTFHMLHGRGLSFMSTLISVTRDDDHQVPIPRMRHGNRPRFGSCRHRHVQEPHEISRAASNCTTGGALETTFTENRGTFLNSDCLSMVSRLT